MHLQCQLMGFLVEVAGAQLLIGGLSSQLGYVKTIDSEYLTWRDKLWAGSLHGVSPFMVFESEGDSNHANSGSLILTSLWFQSRWF